MTRDDAKRIYCAGEELVVATLCTLDERLTKLREQLAKNSRNSSKPPSSDGLKKPNPKSSDELKKKRKRGKGPKRKPGGQKGHEGHGLDPVANPKHIEVLEVHRCEHCERPLDDQDAIDYEARQVFDIPPIEIEVTEHRAEIKECPDCHCFTKAPFPDGVRAPAQYGARIKSIAVYNKVYQLLPYKRCAEFFQDILGVPLSQGTLVNFIKECSRRVEPTIEKIRQALIGAPVAGFDETGCYVQGKRLWLHVACTPQFTYYEIHDKRGCDAMNDIAILPNFTGRAIHDCLQSYFSYDCTHGLCGAHILRELIFLVEVKCQRWADEMIDCLLDMKDAVDQAKEQGRANCDEKIPELQSPYDTILSQGFDENPFPDQHAPADKGKPKKRGRPKKTDAQNLLIRLRDRKKQVLPFLHDFDVPFDNNQSERDLRMIKAQQKISGTFRSARGGIDFCRIRSYISTIRKQSMNTISTIRNVFTDKPTIPSLRGT